MYYAMRASAPSLHRESTDSLIFTLTEMYVIVPIISLCTMFEVIDHCVYYIKFMW